MPNTRINMVCKFLSLLFICAGVFAPAAWANPTIEYTLTHDILSDTWQYTYDVINPVGADTILAFAISFDESLYSDLVIIPLDTAEWSESILFPTVGVPFYDYNVFALGSGILAKQTVSVFTVSFDWIGAGLPGSQPYDIWDPTQVPWEITATGETVPAAVVIIPAPAAVLLALSGLGVLRLRRKSC